VKFFLIAFSLCLALGCNSDERELPETADVSGVVTLDGAPLAGALVSYTAEAYSTSGQTDSEGRYTLPQGAALGENVVTVSKIVGGDDFSQDEEEGMDAGQLGAADPAAVGTKENASGEQIPEKYSHPEMTILKVTVVKGGTDSSDFKLTSK
jgi:hypothetical protein